MQILKQHLMVTETTRIPVFSAKAQSDEGEVVNFDLNAPSLSHIIEILENAKAQKYRVEAVIDSGLKDVRKCTCTLCRLE